jgi:uncharacterized protein (TIGR00251 family)
LFYNVTVSFHADYIEANGDKIEIGVMSRPHKGKANSEINKKIAKYFDVPHSNVVIVSGEKSRNKIIKVTRQTD